MSGDQVGPGPDAAPEPHGAARPPHPTPAEWAVFCVSALAILAVAAVLVGTWVTRPPGPPTFHMTVTPVRPTDGGFHVPVEVENRGSEAAADVQVSAETRIGGETVRAEQMIEFLGPGETATVTFVFDRDPAAADVKVSVTSFGEP